MRWPLPCLLIKSFFYGDSSCNYLFFVSFCLPFAYRRHQETLKRREKDATIKSEMGARAWFRFPGILWTWARRNANFIRKVNANFIQNANEKSRNAGTRERKGLQEVRNERPSLIKVKCVNCHIQKWLNLDYWQVAYG